jgi:ArsR family transcriptional regulator
VAVFDRLVNLWLATIAGVGAAVQGGMVAPDLTYLANMLRVTPMSAPERVRQWKPVALVFRALAHPGRLCIVEELARGERCVCELTEMLGVRMPTVSRHLALLRQAGIVEDEKRGARVFYRLRTPCVLRLFECLAGVDAGANGGFAAPQGAGAGTGLAPARTIATGARKGSGSGRRRPGVHA